MPVDEIRALKPSGLILSGGPASVHDPDAPGCDPAILDLGIPILGVCYGLQWLTRHFGGRVQRSGSREYGAAQMEVVAEAPLFQGLPAEFRVWMSHADEVVEPAPGFQVVGRSASVPCAAVWNAERGIYGVQFHPEVVHTRYGTRIIRNFARRICGCRGRWTPRAYLEQAVDEIRDQVGSAKVICGLSGGVDSTVAAALIHRAIGDRLTCIFVDNGLLRHDEAPRLLDTFQRHLHVRVEFVDAADHFLSCLAGVVEPEAKRKVIGHEFITVFREAAERIRDVSFLAQGTTYPDLIESSGIGKHAQVIKSHHNVGGLPAELGFDLVEPLRLLFKDEVRALGRELDLPDEMVWRQPFPGPGLGVRILGEVTRERLELLRRVDRIVMQEIKAAGWYRRVWQSFAVLLPIQTVGVMGDGRTYENAVALRVVQSTDGMTANWVRLPHALLERLATRITNEVPGVNRVAYDITSKPPGTIEWE
jgi:GMP synthase (glutamine-hydrolysing)